MFFFNIALKIPKILKHSKKNGTNVIVLLVCYRHAKFNPNDSIFGKVMAKKKLLKIDGIKH